MKKDGDIYEVELLSRHVFFPEVASAVAWEKTDSYTVV